MKESFERLVDHLMTGGFFLEEAVEILEKSLIQRALERTQGNRSEASKLLGIHRNTLQRKMDDYSLNGAGARRKPPSRATAPAKRSKARRAGA